MILLDDFTRRGHLMLGSIPPAKVSLSKAVNPCQIQSCPPVVDPDLWTPVEEKTKESSFEPKNVI